MSHGATHRDAPSPARVAAVAAVVACAAAMVASGCRVPATEIQVVIDTDLTWGADGELRAVRVEVGSPGSPGPARVFELGAGRSALPLVVSVIPRGGDPERIARIEVRGCRSVDDCEPAVATARAVVGFVPRETRRLRLWLARRCAYVRCADAARTCDPALGYCVDARRDVRALPAARDALVASEPPPALPGALAELALGEGYTCALAREGGAATCFGRRAPGHAARAPVERALPFAVAGLRDATRVAAAHAHLCVVTRAGAVACAGANESGQLGDGTRRARDEVAPVTDESGAPLVGARDVGVGRAHACALLGAEGRVVCWGDDSVGQLGDGGAEPVARARAAPTVPPLTDATQLAVGMSSACALLRDGGVACWGAGYGAHPTRVGGLGAAAEVRVGWTHACARLRDGSVRCWGANTYGQLGARGTEPLTGPVAPDGLGEPDTVAAGLATLGFHTCARIADGTARCWGRNDLGQLGAGVTHASSAPVAVAGLAGILALGAGGDHACALVLDRARGTPVDPDAGAATGAATTALHCWGGDLSGETGSRRVLSRVSPEIVRRSELRDVVASAGQACGLERAVARCWGQLATGARPPQGERATPDTARQIEPPTTVPVLPSPYDQVALGDAHGCGLLRDGTVRCWGDNAAGQLGYATAPSTGEPRAVPGVARAVAVAAGGRHTCVATEPDGAVACWGDNAAGQLGGGVASPEPRARPAPVGGLSGARALAAGDDFTCAVTGADGHVVCWGNDARGQLGRGVGAGVAARPERAGALTNIDELAAGAAHACVREGSGRVVCWGDNTRGQLGDGTTAASRASPVEVAALTDARAIAAGAASSCAVRASGAVVCWGRNDDGELGDGTRRASTVPVPVAGVSDAVGVRVGTGFACALIRDGSVQCWGASEAGELGAGTRTPRDVPAPVVASDAPGAPRLSRARALAAHGAQACAVLDPTGVRCWGADDHGQLGDGRWSRRLTPVIVAGVRDPVAIDGGGASTCAVLADRTVACWGSNGSGRLGDGTELDRLAPTPVADLTDAVQVRVGRAHACARTSAGRVWCWGDNARGQLGAPGDGRRPREVALPRAAESIDVGGDHSCARLDDGTVACWGDAQRGQLGAGSASPAPQYAPALARSGPAGEVLTDVTALRLGDAHTCVVRATGVAECAGANEHGQLGADDTADRAWFAPVDVSRFMPAGESRSFGAVAPGSAHTCAAVPGLSGSVACWGANERGQLGVADAQLAPVERVRGLPVSHQLDVASGARFACVRSSDPAYVHCWGANDVGQLGSGARRDVAVAGPVIGLGPTTQLTAGAAHACAGLFDGRVACWGRNHAGQLGDGSVDAATTPVPLAGSAGVVRLAVGLSHRCAVLDDGTARCWGANEHGQLGDGTRVDRALPEPVVGLRDALQLEANAAHTCARLADGTACCWGQNDAFQLGAPLAPGGDGVPLRVGVLREVEEVRAGGAHTCARLRDGAVWCWGSDRFGQVGDGGVLLAGQRPTAVLQHALEVRAGGAHTCARLDDGTAQCWGRNARGQLGDGTRVDRPASTAVLDASGHVLRGVAVLGAGSDHRCTRALVDGALRCEPSGEDHTCAIVEGGAVLCWGRNDRGQLGDGTREDRASPVAVAGVTGATELSVGGQHTCARTAAGPWCWGDNAAGQLLDDVEAVRPMPARVELGP